MYTAFIKGVIVPIITPIDKNDLIVEAKLRKQVDFVINGGVSGILAFGSNGEFYAVDDDEMERGLKIMVDHAAGRVPIYLGIGAIRTGKCIKLAKMGAAAGAMGISVLQPMFIKPSQDELYDYFRSIAEAVRDTPVLLYNNPGRTGYTMSCDLVEKLARNVPNIVGMKDSSGDITQTCEFIRRTSDVGFKVLGGKDTIVFGSLVHGAVGCVATTANFVPDLVVSICEKYKEGDIAGALDAQFKLNPIRLAMDKASFPVGTKDYVNLAGLDMGEPYLPNKSTKGPILDQMRECLKKAGYLK